MKNKKHLTEEGVNKIAALKGSSNRGLSNKQKLAFPHVAPVPRPKVKHQKIQDPNWLAGFASAEGCFKVLIQASQTHSLGFNIRLEFQVTQHMRDEQLLRSLTMFWECGNVYKNRDTYDFKVTKIKDLTEKIIPFFEKYPIKGVKAKDFNYWCRVAELTKEKKHLTEEGLKEIRKIKAEMNSERKWSK